MSSSWLVLFAALVPGIPAAMSLALLALGRAVGTPLSGYLGIAGAFASLFASLATMVGWLVGGASWGFGDRPLVIAVPWLEAAPVHLALGLQLDSLGVAWSFTVTLLGAIVSVFLAAESRRDARSHRQVAAVGFLLAGATLNAVAGSLLLLSASLGSLFAAGWLGASHDAGQRVVARRAAGIALAGAACVALLGTASAVCVHDLGGTSLRLLMMQPVSPGRSVVAVLVVLGVGVAMGLFPFQPWLVRLAFAPPGPRTLAAIVTPLSAMLVLLRVDGLLTPESRQLLLILSTFTLALQSASLLFQAELPRTFLVAGNVGFALPAWLLARGDVAAASWLAPAMAIALASVGVGLGAIVHVTRGEQALSRLGGLIVKLPITGMAVAIGMLSVSGMMFSGVGQALRWRSDGAGWMTWIPVAITALLAFGLARPWLSAFFGEPRHLRSHARASEQPMLWGAAVAAATFAMMCGFEWFPLHFLVEQAPLEQAGLTASDVASPVTRPATANVAESASLSSSWGWASGVAVAVLAWWRQERRSAAKADHAVFPSVSAVAREGFFFDDFYRALVGGVGTILADALARIDAWTQRWVIVAVQGTLDPLARGIAVLDEATVGEQAARAMRWPWMTAAAIAIVAGGLIGAVLILLR